MIFRLRVGHAVFCEMASTIAECLTRKMAGCGEEQDSVYLKIGYELRQGSQVTSVVICADEGELSVLASRAVFQLVSVIPKGLASSEDVAYWKSRKSGYESLLTRIEGFMEARYVA